MAAKGGKAKGLIGEWSRKARKAISKEKRSTTNAQALADQDAECGNAQIARGKFILERMRQEGCLAIEAAERYDRGER